MIQLGDIAKDSITGFKGTVIAVTQWFHGCKRLVIQPNELGKDGKPIEAHTFDEPQVTLVKAMNHKPIKDPGGPRPDPVRR